MSEEFWSEVYFSNEKLKLTQVDFGSPETISYWLNKGYLLVTYRHYLHDQERFTKLRDARQRKTEAQRKRRMLYGD